MELTKEEELENEIIIRLREFSEEDWHKWTTGFQRVIAQGIIDLVREEDPC